MSDCADDLSVLKNGGTGHSLDDASGLFQQLRIRHPDFQPPVHVIMIQVYGRNLHSVFPGNILVIHAAQDSGFSDSDILLQADGHRLFQETFRKISFQSAKNPFHGILFDRSDPVFHIVIDHSCQFSGHSVLSLFDVHDLRPVQAPLPDVHQKRRIGIVDSMPKGAERSILFQIGHGTHALGVVPDIFPSRILLGFYLDVENLSVPADGQNHLLPAAGCNFFRQLLFGGKFLPVRFQNVVSRHEQVPGGLFYRMIQSLEIPLRDHHHAVRFDIDADGHAGRDQHFVRNHLNVHRFEGNDAEELYIHLILLSPVGYHRHRAAQIHLQRRCFAYRFHLHSSGGHRLLARLFGVRVHHPANRDIQRKPLRYAGFNPDGSRDFFPCKPNPAAQNRQAEGGQQRRNQEPFFSCIFFPHHFTSFPYRGLLFI